MMRQAGSTVRNGVVRGAKGGVATLFFYAYETSFIAENGDQKLTVYPSLGEDGVKKWTCIWQYRGTVKNYSTAPTKEQALERLLMNKDGYGVFYAIFQIVKDQEIFCISPWNIIRFYLTQEQVKNVCEVNA